MFIHFWRLEISIRKWDFQIWWGTEIVSSIGYTHWSKLFHIYFIPRFYLYIRGFLAGQILKPTDCIFESRRKR